MAKKFKSEIILYHVYESSRVVPFLNETMIPINNYNLDLREEKDQQSRLFRVLWEWSKEASSEGLKCHPFMDKSPMRAMLSDLIFEFCKKVEASAVFLCAQKSKWASFFSESTIQHIVRDAEFPVFIVRGDALESSQKDHFAMVS